MAEAQFTKGFVKALDKIIEGYKECLIKEKKLDEMEAMVVTDNLSDAIYDHADHEALLPLARTRELENPLRKSKYDCILGQLQLRSVLIPPVWDNNTDVLFVRYHKIFHASSNIHNSESTDKLFDD